MRFAMRIAAALAVVLTAAGELRAQGNERILLDNWSYAAIERFETLGYCVLPENRPLSRGQFTSIVRAIHERTLGRSLSARDRYEIDRLYREYAPVPGMGGYYDREWRAADADLVLEGDLDVSSYVEQAPYADETEVYVASSPEFRLHKGAWFTWDLRYQLLFGPEHGDRARGHKPSRREKSFKGLTSQFDRSYLLFNLSSVELLAGRDHVDWGPSEDGGLIVPGERHSLDQIGARLFFRRFRYDAFFAQLFTDPERYLVGHRLEGTFGRTVVGVSETVTYGGRGPDWMYALPFASYYANQYNERTNADNILWSLDAKTGLFDRVTAHASFLIDDLQFERGDGYPDKLAAEIGFRFVPARPLGLALRGSYRRVDVYTYSHDDSLSVYVSGAGEIDRGDVLLGGPPGGDGDAWRLAADLFPRANFRVTLAAYGGRVGEGNPIRAFELNADDPTPPFPSGVVQETIGFEVGTRWELEGNRWLAAAWTHESADNRGRVAGNDESTDAFRVEIRWDIP